MNFVVCKFGGTSVATTERIQQVAKILELNPNRRCVVLSAPGKAPHATVKVTDLLIRTSEKLRTKADTSEEVAAIKKRFEEIYVPLGLPESTVAKTLEDLDRRVASDVREPKKLRDLLAAAGEDMNARLFAEYLKFQGKAAVYVSPAEAGLHVTDSFGDAQPLEDVSLKLAHLKKVCADEIVVFPGFFGVTRDGDVATFSRGGSDLTAALLAEAIEAVEYENWTDVDGIGSASPLVVDSPVQIPALTYREMRELSYMGFNVLHEEAVWPAMRKRIPIRLRNTNNLDNTGTLIVSERLPTERAVVGIAGGGEFCSLTVQKYLMNREKGFGRELLAIIEELDLSYEHCPSSVDTISVILRQDQIAEGTMHNMVRAIEERLAPDEITTEYGISLIAVVGEGLYHRVGVLAEAATALAKAQVNIKIANQGSSEISMIFGVDASDENDAVRALYSEFFPNV